MSIEESEPAKNTEPAKFVLTELESRVLQRCLPIRYVIVEVTPHKCDPVKVSQPKTPKKEPKNAKIIEEHQPQRESRPRRAPVKKYDKYLEDEPERPTKPKQVSPDPRDQDSHIEASQEKPESPAQNSQKAQDVAIDNAR